MSWKLQVGEIKTLYTTENEIWQALNNFYYRSNVTMSYKYGFFKAIIENLYNVNEYLELNYDQLFYSFTKIYWNLVVHHHLWQSNNKKQLSAIQRILEQACKKYEISNECTFDRLDYSIQINIISEIKKVGKKYVIGAFYGDTHGLFYEFDLKKEHLKFSVPVYQFLQKHQRVLISLTNYQLAKFLEKYNSVPDINYLLQKVEVISQRESLNEFYTILYTYESHQCFYCGKYLSSKRNATHIDHFIPWSFVQTDQLWNLVMACPDCNLRKNDKLAEEQYLHNIMYRNEYLMNRLDGEKSVYFENYKSQKLEKLYEYSLLNGYVGTWKPKLLENNHMIQE